jgi:hypothetical protein
MHDDRLFYTSINNIYVLLNKDNKAYLKIT